MQLNVKNQPVTSKPFSGTLSHKNNPSAHIWEVLLSELYELGLSQKTIAKGSHISIPTIKRLERNQVSPSAITFSRLLAFYCSVATNL